MRNSPGFIPTVDSILASLDKSPSLELGLDLCNEILKLMGFEIKSSAPDIIDKGLVQLPNSERYDSWFQPHPWMGGERAAFELNDLDTTPLQAKFYWLNKRSRQFIAGSVHFTENWEDSDYTHNDKFRAGIDFFLSPNGKSLQVVLSSRGNLRIVELHKRLNNTQVEIFAKWESASQLTTQEALHNTLWESFKLKAVNEKFYAEIANNFTLLTQHLKTINKDEEESKLFASRLLGRLLFCWFLRKKGIIDESMDYFSADGLDSTKYYRQSLERLFFLTLNTPIDERDELSKNHQKELIHVPSEDKQSSFFKVDDRTPYLNGGLFEPHTNDWFKDKSLTFPAGYFVNLYKHFDEFNFTTDESTPEYEQIAIDPEMLGRVFESLLATQIDETGKKATKAKGTFYTPREIVSYMCKEALRNHLYNQANDDVNLKSAIDGLLDTTDSEWAKAGTNSRRDTVKDYRVQIIEGLDKVSILDPACGSGAFPMGMVQLFMKIYERLESRFDPYKTKLQIIQNNIFGVDIEPMAVEIARLRAWLSLIVDEFDTTHVEPLPNLDFKFICANSLMPLGSSLFDDPELHLKLKELREKYFIERRPEIKKKLQENYYSLINQKNLFEDIRTKHLQSFNPFINSQPSEFFNTDQMFGLKDGFDIVIGNPPYGAKLSTEDKKRYLTVYRSAISIPGRQRGSLDTYSLFIDLGLHHVMKNKGVLCYIVPLAFTSSESMSALHGMMLNECDTIQVSSYSNRPKKIFDNADQRVSIVLADKTGTKITKLLTTGVLKRYSTTSVREIIDGLSFVNSIEFIQPGRLPKIGTQIELDILAKLKQQKRQLRDYIAPKETNNAVFYRTSGGRYYHIVTTNPTGSSKEKPIYIKKSLDPSVVASILSSNLYFWLSQAYSNNLDLNLFEVLMCPIPDIDEHTTLTIAETFKQYALDLEKNATIKKADYNNISEFKEYRARLSKRFIDKFDQLLQKSYNFTDEETSFLINFEIKFRTDDISVSEETT